MGNSDKTFNYSFRVVGSTVEVGSPLIEVSPLKKYVGI